MKKLELMQMENLLGGGAAINTTIKVNKVRSGCATALLLGIVGIGLGIVTGGAAPPVTAAGMVGIAVGCLDD